MNTSPLHWSIIEAWTWVIHLPVLGFVLLVVAAFGLLALVLLIVGFFALLLGGGQT